MQFAEMKSHYIRDEDSLQARFYTLHILTEIRVAHLDFFSI